MRMMIAIGLLGILVLAGCAGNKVGDIKDFEDCVKAGNPVMESQPRQCRAGDNTFTEEAIGGQRDENGCLGPAGFAWSETVGACIKGFELDDDQKRAAQIAVAPYSMKMTVISVETARCPGCFNVILERNDNQERIVKTLSNWNLFDAPGQMPALEHVCTADEKAAEACTLDYTPVCGNNQETYGNACAACASKQIESYIVGECGSQPKERPIGGDTDDKGCLIGAGYSWSEDAGACIRQWELSSQEIKAARIAADSFTTSMTIVSVEYLGDEGSYKVTLQDNRNQERSEVTMRDWDVSGIA